MTTDAASPRRATRAGLIVPWVIAAVLAGGYAVYWFAIAGTVQAAIAEAATRSDSRTAGRVGSVRATGFPFRLSFELSDVNVESRVAGWGLGAEAIRLTAMPWNLTHWILDRPEAITIRDPGGRRWAVAPETLEASVRWGTGGLRRLSVVSGGVKATREGGAEVRLAKGSAHLQADPRSEGDLAFVTDLEGLDLPGTPDRAAVLGPQIEKARLAGLLPDGQRLLRDPAGWVAGGGALDVKAGALRWGALDVADVTGQLGVDGAGRINANLEGAGGLTAGDIGFEPRIALVIREGVAEAGGVRLMTLPPLVRDQSSR